MNEFEDKMLGEDELKQKISENGKIPEHVAVIMDGNGRWANKRGLSRIKGHEEGINSVRAVVEACGDLGIKVLTLYTFSKENWRGLWRLLIKTIRKEVPELKKNNVRLMTIGVLSDLPFSVREGVRYAINELKDNTGLIVNLALSYGSRIEIVHAVQRIATKIAKKEIFPEQIDEKLIEDHLYTAGLPDPDLVIRTSGEKRISNFLLWQIAYTEIYITETLWPDFKKKDLIKAIEVFNKRERRFGGI